ncbi:CLUMA_CG012774, isoform A [Clunio marinus]|uniref:CLUMA_CG012774, isoform A n=1 Tax=Clunio marinus TaxID=568069 RepID=A0A1J1IGG2_9DIPT|nr:CLUMA_CG012774, isoform A [Clunio marinus]
MVRKRAILAVANKISPSLIISLKKSFSFPQGKQNHDNQQYNGDLIKIISRFICKLEINNVGVALESDVLKLQKLIRSFQDPIQQRETKRERQIMNERKSVKIKKDFKAKDNL